MSSGRCELRMRMWQRRLRRHKTTQAARGRERKTREVKEGKNILEEGQNTWRCKWNGRTSRAMHKLHKMSCQSREEEHSTAGAGGGRAEGKHKDRAKRCDTDWQQQNWNERDAARHSKVGSRRRAWGGGRNQGEGREVKRVRGDRKTLIFFYCGRRAQ